MKILSCNQNYFIRGGSDKYFFDMNQLLEKEGHNVIPFTAHSPKNVDSDYSNYFPQSADFDNPSIFDVYNYVYNRQANKNIQLLLDSQSPDIAHLHIYYGKLTSAILSPLKKRGIPIIQTLHEYKLVCPVYTMYKDGLCHKCSGGKFYNCLLNKCNRNSLTRSMLSTIESYFSSLMGAWKDIDAFICVSDYQKEQLMLMGLEETKLHTIHNFVDSDLFTPTYKNKGYFLYYGRIEEVKGLKVLVDAFRAIKSKSTCRLLIVGDGSYKKELQDYCKKALIENVEFHPHYDFNELKPIIENSIATVMPSLWYETFGLTVLESYSAGKPVIASSIGGMTETVIDNETGFLVEPGNSEQIAEKMQYLLSNPEATIELGKKAKNRVDEFFSKQVHLNKIEQLYTKVLDAGTNR